MWKIRVPIANSIIKEGKNRCYEILSLETKHENITTSEILVVTKA
ncbi:hypothetical protein H1P_3330013 [Hyella patelloides LEGE 07179]|uniref:Uncharacterized protein n=1 Tax=Hyella patelloides LEGE 07179 TaxID=945734 RepID=A0A563VVD4_9CYAN|nr:hypothetical protein H1P_3330013 [Hyella patelloides LEGE 07179]